MFDTMEIAKKIKQSRIDKNMTQMQLADAMGVSYQAVSNWERGNSMPDISKLADLCTTLGITVDELLGVSQPAAAAVTKVMEQDELSMEELVEVAPMLPPEEVKERVEAKRYISLPDMGFFKNISDTLKKTFTEEKKAQMKEISDTLKENFAKERAVQPEKKVEEKNRSKKKKKLDLSAIADLAPFLDEEYLDELVMEAAQSGDLEGLDDLVPFLSKKTLDQLVEMADQNGLEILADLAPFLSDRALETLARKCVESSDYGLLGDLAPFISDGTMDMVVDHCIQTGNVSKLEDLYPFMSKETLRKIANQLVKNRDFDALEEITDYM